MGCFSYKCKECGTPINSSSFDGEECRLYFLRSGKIQQEMHGAYDSYGRVFGEEWDGEWCELVDAHFNDDESTGFAAVHEACYKIAPVTISSDDPNQGWGKLRKKYMRKQP